MIKTYYLTVLLLLISSQSYAAGKITTSDTVSNPSGGLSSHPLDDIINQSGLSSSYIKGSTDFTSFVTSTTSTGLSDSGFTRNLSNGPEAFTFGFDDLVTLDAIAIWNTTSVGAIDSFALYSDTDMHYGNGTLHELLPATNLLTSNSEPVSAQVFSFSPVTTHYIHVVGLSTLSAPDYYGLSEVAFSQISSPVPEPSSLGLMLAGLGLMTFQYKRKSRA